MNENAASNPVTPEEARRALRAASEATVATAADRRWLQWGLVVIGMAVGLLILALRATVGEPTAPKSLQVGGLAAAMVVYLAAVVLAVVLSRRAKAAPRGYNARYLVGLFLSMAVYAVYVVVSSGDGKAAIAWPWAVAAALIAAAPALIAARSISRLALR